MYCEKCNGELKPNTKFCVFCGAPVNVNQTLQKPQDTLNNNVVQTQANSIPNQEIANVNPASLQNNLNNNIGPVPVNNVSNEVRLVEPIPVVENAQNSMNNNIGPVPVNNVSNEVRPVEPIPVVESPQTPSKKRNNKLVFVILGIILVLLALFLFVFSFMKSSGSSIDVLKQALANMNKIESGVTINLSIEAESEGMSLNFSGVAKIDQKENKTDMQIKLNKSAFTEEINLYASILDYKATAYIESSVVDMLLGIESNSNKWLYISEVIEKDEINIDDIEQNISDTDIISIIDEKNFVYIDENNGLKHYQLVIDEELINKLKEEISKLNIEEYNDILESLESIDETIRIDYYINSNNELTKISFDMSSYLEDAGISKLVLTIGISDINKTTVEIPQEAINSKDDLETYINESSNTLENSDDELIPQM